LELVTWNRTVHLERLRTSRTGESLGFGSGAPTHGELVGTRTFKLALKPDQGQDIVTIS
jgi:hypothetical protein